jgi:pimeloyl-ACP methyl ester carboxylesterase
MSSQCNAGKQHAATGEARELTLAGDLATFERKRLSLFARNGFEGESRWVTDRKGRRTYMIGRGKGSCPTVLVHGGLSQGSEWALLAGRLPGHVIIPDRPGCGLSYRIDYRGLDYRRAAIDWMRDLVDGIDAEQVDLVGNSMGGYFSIVLALAYPERVRRLVLVGMPAGIERWIPLFLRLWGNPILGLPIRQSRIADAETLRKRVFGPLLVAHPERVPRDFLEIMVHAMALPDVDRSAYSLLRACTTLRGFRPELMLRDDMARLTVPALFLWGDADAFAPPSSGQDVVARMTNARVEILPDTGHLPHVDQPDAVAATIIKFTSRGEM